MRRRRGLPNLLRFYRLPSIVCHSGACNDQGMMLWGEVAFGDNVEDEWFIVSLLLRVTRNLPGLSAR